MLVLHGARYSKKLIDINQDIDILSDSESSGFRDVEKVNGSQLAKLNKSIPDMSLPWNL